MLPMKWASAIQEVIGLYDREPSASATPEPAAQRFHTAPVASSSDGERALQNDAGAAHTSWKRPRVWSRPGYIT